MTHVVTFRVRGTDTKWGELAALCEVHRYDVVRHDGKRYRVEEREWIECCLYVEVVEIVEREEPDGEA